MTTDEILKQSGNNANTALCAVGDHIKCWYWSQCIRGIVTDVQSKHIVVKLHTAYQGINEYWGVGELKVLYKKIIKDLKVVANCT